LSNEVFYEIFDYLDGGDIYKTFYNLNFRFQQIITCPSLLFKISLEGKSPSELRNCPEAFIIPNRQHLVSLKLRDSPAIDKFFIQRIINSSFTRLESFHLVEISSIKLMTILIHLISLPRLFSLRIDLKHDNSNHFNQIYQMIFLLPCLKYNKLSILTQEKLNIAIPIATNGQFSTIEYLVLSHICDLNELASILRHTPRLKHLICQSLIGSDEYIENEVPITLPTLIHVSIDDCRVKFDEFKNFMKKISSQLQVLRIDSFQNINFISPGHWERLISQSMPNLFRFTLKYHMPMKYYTKDSGSHTFINRFNSQFWFERGWIFRLEIKHEKISYLIYPNRYSDERPFVFIHRSFLFFRKTCFISHKNANITTYTNQNTHDSSMQFSSSIELSIANYSAVLWEPSLLDTLRPVLFGIEFKSLNLFWSGMSYCTLAKLLNLLPNLDSLKVSSSLLVEGNSFPLHDAENLCIHNKITKVWQWMEFVQLQFFVKTFPCMEYFEVNGIKDIDLEMAVRFILMKTVTHILHLHSLRLCVYNANDRMIHKLQNMIDSEKLLSNYMIKRLENVISLQWRLE
jgi:hypothetical protein